AAEGEAAVALPPLTRRLPHLSMLANVATLLGLLGTIFGLTTAFAAVGAADPSQRSAFLAAGISQALNTTAFGLIVAVPTLLLHAFYVAKVERIVEQADEMSHRLIQVLANSAGGESAGQAASHTSGPAHAPGHEPQTAARAKSEGARVVLR
ncbi:MAG: MotA/TolQ/ExbB proton channel family protein, partial [Gemmatimonadetes bacterium]|nr:MotA/TolQ/ExbB proton channel family protein [Gemmatimonadota bacterium]